MIYYRIAILRIMELVWPYDDIYIYIDDAYIEEYGTNPDGATTTETPDGTTKSPGTTDGDTTTTEAKRDGSDGFMIGTLFAFIMTVFGYIMQ